MGWEEAEDIRIFFLLLLLAARWGDDYMKKVEDAEFVLRTKESSKIRQSFILAEPQHFWSRYCCALPKVNALFPIVKKSTEGSHHIFFPLSKNWVNIFLSFMFPSTFLYEQKHSTINSLSVKTTHCDRSLRTAAAGLTFCLITALKNGFVCEFGG